MMRLLLFALVFLAAAGAAQAQVGSAGPVSGGIATPAGGPLNLHGSGTAPYDAQTQAVGGGAQVNLGEWETTAVISHFFTYDGTEQFRVGSIPEAADYLMAEGGIATRGPTVFCGSATDTNVPCNITTQGTGPTNFYSGSNGSPLFSIVDPGLSGGAYFFSVTNGLSYPKLSSSVNADFDVPVGYSNIFSAGGAPVLETSQAGTGTPSSAYVSIFNYTGDSYAHMQCMGSTNTGCYWGASGTGGIQLFNAASGNLFGVGGTQDGAAETDYIAVRPGDANYDPSFRTGSLPIQFLSPIIVGTTSRITVSGSGIGIDKMTADGTAPGTYGGKIEAVCGTNAGTMKLIVYAGTSATPTTLLDNIGAGVNGC